MLPFTAERVLLPYDFSATGDRLLRESCEHYGQQAGETRVTVLHVLSPLTSTDPGALWQTLPIEQRRKKVEAEFWQRFSSLRQFPHPPTLHVAIGEPGAMILQQAQKENSDLIILPSHGRRGVQRLLLGSVAEMVVRCAPCPVLVVKSV